ncbi:aminotransferase class I/II-fold pyridoxal phosphate-dependent enzyme [Flagellimonas flava]|uniref:8-amino-7-oxononanoate synthase n=1 Tax=Flagellimonas flava TaxID=570519 RepID=A0A1M5KIA0_9FLAO|nr:aminotransferase class I/II-fold pyridoxal phosphate-dependent enzyme [Allomuricauda flava]SHG52497.1 8-amino-7-oxononanoate synthase [Allomuricauda flava]
MGELPEKLRLRLDDRSGVNALRSLPKHENLVDFSSNDYLGISGEGIIQTRAIEILKEKQIEQSGSTGSRLLTGNHLLFAALETFLAKHHNAESALVFNSGYDANIGFFSSVPQRNDFVFYDELVHASIRDGIKMGLAKGYKFAHNNLLDLHRKIENTFRKNPDKGIEIYIVTESVFSMDGDTPDLTALAKFCSDNGYHLVVDEAHATGIHGEGTDMVKELELETAVFARIITFGKALGCHGAAILGSQELKTYLVNFARSLIYTTALSPHTVATVLATYQYLEDKGFEKRTALQENIRYFNKLTKELGIQDFFVNGNAAIQCLVSSGNQQVKVLSERLRKAGYNVKPILSPTVEKGKERLRFCLHAHNTKQEIDGVLNEVKKSL